MILELQPIGTLHSRRGDRFLAPRQPGQAPAEAQARIELVKGVLATRSPHRPNPLGISAVPLLGVQGHTLWLGQHDLLDGTPILDIKPYLPSVDCFPEEREGWLEASLAPFLYRVSLTPEAQRQMDHLVAHYHPDFAQRVYSVLESDPLPLRSRRICQVEGGYRLGCGPWRVFFQVQDREVLIERVSDIHGRWPDS